MAVKTFEVADIGVVNVHKSKKSKHLRLSIRPDGSIRVSIPYWISYAAGLHFAESKRDWLQKQLIPVRSLKHGDRIGKHHRLSIVSTSGLTIRSRVTETEVIIHKPASVNHAELQKHIEKACVRALKQESESLLVQRLKTLAANNDFHFNSVSVRQLKGRWGSCSTKKDIVLSCYLIQLNWEEIDYVLFHELTHTLYMSHGTEFWRHFSAVFPKAKTIRKQMKQHKPVVFATN